MSELVSVVVSLFVTAVIASLASSILFGDYREGFRILYQMLGSTDSNPGPSDVPKEPKSSLFVQIAFGAGCLVAASICYIALSPVFARLEVFKVGSQFRSKAAWISCEFPHRSAQQGASSRVAHL